MIEVIAIRRTNLNGTLHKKGAKLSMPLQQFNDLEPTGRFERAPAEIAAPPPSSGSPKRVTRRPKTKLPA